MRRFRSALAGALIVASAGVGCGGAEEKSLSKTEYVKRGDAICKKANAEGEKKTEKFFAGRGPDYEPSDEELTTFVEEVLKPNAEGLLSDLRDLPVPEDDADEVNEIYEASETALAKVENDPGLILSGSDPFQEANDAAGDYGFKECSGQASSER